VRERGRKADAGPFSKLAYRETKTLPTAAPLHSRTSGASVKSTFSSGMRASAASSFACFLEAFFEDLPYFLKIFRIPARIPIP
jgi:hypothetical protein